MARKQLTDLDFVSVAKPINLPDPTDAQDAATKAYVDSTVEGLAWKDAARVATQGNLDIASPGASIDGIAMASGDRVLVVAQTTTSENGIYLWSGAAVPMSRSPDASTFEELEQAVVTVEEGTSEGATYRQTEINGTIDVSDVLWTTFGTSAPPATESTAGIMELATQGEADAGTDDQRAMTPAKARNASWRVRKHAADVGDGVELQYSVTHNFNTRDLVVSVSANASPFDEVICDVEHTTVNAVTVRFAAAPTSNQYRVVVIG